MANEMQAPANASTHSSPNAAVPAAEANVENRSALAAINSQSTSPTKPAENYPYWVPAGVELANWPAHIREQVAAVINPEYEALVVNGTPGVGRQMAISLLHLGWLEILDHLRLGRLVPPPAAADHEEIIGIESRQAVIARHLRLVNAKLKISQFLLRLDEFKANCRPRPDKELPSDEAILSAQRLVPPTQLLHYVMENGKDDIC
jgi:hypothetical protein